MLEKIAIKKLTASDLTLFKWHFLNKNAGNQKAINLNRDPFIDVLYPSLPEIAEKKNGKILLELLIFGPGLASEYSLSRKIVKGDTYKNWRLDGEFIFDPPDFPNRFNVLDTNDIAIFVFSGTIYPVSIRAFFIAKQLKDDAGLYRELSTYLGNRSMAAIEQEHLSSLIRNANPPADHPVCCFLISDALEDAALGGAEGILRLSEEPSMRVIAPEDFDRAKTNAEEIGKIGEQFISDYLSKLRRTGKIIDFEWVSKTNAISPYDFRIIMNNNQTVFIDAKSTRNRFDNAFNVSYNELLAMRSLSERYDIYRVYEIKEGNASLRIGENLKPFAENLMEIFKNLPKGIRPNGISVSPSLIGFGPEIRLEMVNES